MPLAARCICFSELRPTEVTVIWQPLPTIAAAWSTTSALSTPTVQMACSASWPRVISATACCASPAAANTCVAPNSSALARLNSTGSTTTTFAAPA